MKLVIPRYEEGAIGLPTTRAMVISNSERTQAMCPRRWWFSTVEGLRSPPRDYHRFGQAWHSTLEDVHKWWARHDGEAYPGDGAHCVWCDGKATRGGRYRGLMAGSDTIGDCDKCGGDGLGPIGKFTAVLRKATNPDGWPVFESSEVDAQTQTLFRCLEGWFERYTRYGYESYRVTGVEVPAARQIVNPNGSPYTSDVYLVQESTGELRVAGTGEVSGVIAPTGEIIKVRWPWYQVARFDAVLQHRTTGVLYIDEWKTSASPQTLMQGLNVDPQTDGYVWVLEAVRGKDLRIPDGPIGGYLYDVVSSKPQVDPKELKPVKVKALDPVTGEPYKVKGRWAYQLDGAGNPIMRSHLSTAASATVTSWRYIEAVKRLGLDESDYAEHIQMLRQTNDQKLYQRAFGTVGPLARERYAEEVYAIAVKHAQMRRNATRARTANDLNIHFPRVPICRLPGGSCPYRAPCLEDGDEVRASFERTPGITWKESR